MTKEQEKHLQTKYRFRLSKHLKEHITALSKERGIEAQALEKQFMPNETELIENPEYVSDPLYEDDTDIHPIEDVIHKYANKILILTSHQCPVYCRYCTRKRRTLNKNHSANLNLKAISNYLDENQQINEVILSGGDPLMLGLAELASLLEILSQKDIEFIRIHTRVVTTIPSKISTAFLELLNRFQTKKQIISFVLHINHGSELSMAAVQSISRLSQSAKLYSQTVLLNDINNDSNILKDLFVKLFRLDIQPYYLHQLDQVEGSMHFHVSITEGKKIMQDLRQLIPPYMLPRYVQDSKQGKTNLFY